MYLRYLCCYFSILQIYLNEYPILSFNYIPYYYKLIVSNTFSTFEEVHLNDFWVQGLSYTYARNADTQTERKVMATAQKNSRTMDIFVELSKNLLCTPC